MKHCKECGSKLLENVKFCGNCGARTISDRQSSHGLRKGIALVLVLFLLIGLGVGGFFGYDAWKRDRDRTATAIAEAQQAAALAQVRAEEAEARAREEARQMAAELQQQLQEKDWRDSCIRKCDIESSSWVGGCVYYSSTIGLCQCRCVDIWGKTYYINR